MCPPKSVAKPPSPPPAPEPAPPSSGGGGAAIAALTARLPHPQAALIERAWRESCGALPGPEAEDCLVVARLLTDLNLDHESVAAALLAPAVAASAIDAEAVRARFGATVARLVDGVGRMDSISEYRTRTPETERGAEQARLEGVEAEAITTVGKPYDSILESAEGMGADLIVIGAYGKTALKRFVMGSIVEKVVGNSGCAVLVVNAIR